MSQPLAPDENTLVNVKPPKQNNLKTFDLTKINKKNKIVLQSCNPLNPKFSLQIHSSNKCDTSLTKIPITSNQKVNHPLI